MKTFFSKNKNAVLVLSDDQRSQAETHSIFAYQNFHLLPIIRLNISNLECLSKLEQRQLRLYNKNTLLAIECLEKLNLNDHLKQFSSDRIGLYVAGPWTVLNSQVMNATQTMSPFNAMKSFFNPKYNLKNMLSHLPGHLSIHYKINGPTNCFQDTNCGTHAMQCAEWDLQSDFVDLAIVICLNTYEELITAAEHTLIVQSEVLCEAASAILIKKNDIEIAKDASLDYVSVRDLGYVNPLRYIWGV